MGSPKRTCYPVRISYKRARSKATRCVLCTLINACKGVFVCVLWGGLFTKKKKKKIWTTHLGGHTQGISLCNLTYFYILKKVFKKYAEKREQWWEETEKEKKKKKKGIVKHATERKNAL